jgi:hypothetical protein
VRRAVQVYNVSAGKSLPQWLSDKKKKSLRKDDEFRCALPGAPRSRLLAQSFG